jgi:hypothetical protein
MFKQLLRCILNTMQQHYTVTPVDSCLHYTIFASTLAGTLAFAFIPSLSGLLVGTLALSAAITASATCFYSHPNESSGNPTFAELPKED